MSSYRLPVAQRRSGYSRCALSVCTASRASKHGCPHRLEPKTWQVTSPQVESVTSWHQMGVLGGPEDEATHTRHANHPEKRIVLNRNLKITEMHWVKKALMLQLFYCLPIRCSCRAQLVQERMLNGGSQAGSEFGSGDKEGDLKVQVHPWRQQSSSPFSLLPSELNWYSNKGFRRLELELQGSFSQIFCLNPLHVDHLWAVNNCASMVHHHKQQKETQVHLYFQLISLNFYVLTINILLEKLLFKKGLNFALNFSNGSKLKTNKNN